MLLRPAAARRLELRLSTAQGGQAARGLARDESLQARVQESRLFVDAGELGGLAHQLITKDNCRSHAYEYAFALGRCQRPAPLVGALPRRIEAQHLARRRVLYPVEEQQLHLGGVADQTAKFTPSGTDVAPSGNGLPSLRDSGTGFSPGAPGGRSGLGEFDQPTFAGPRQRVRRLEGRQDALAAAQQHECLERLVGSLAPRRSFIARAFPGTFSSPMTREALVEVEALRGQERGASIAAPGVDHDGSDGGLLPELAVLRFNLVETRPRSTSTG